MKKKICRSLMTVCSVLIVACMLVACSSTSNDAASNANAELNVTPSEGEDKQTVKVAVMCPLSGQSSRFGEIYKASIEAAYRAITEDNYLENYELEFEFIDDKMTTEAAPIAATYALDQYECNVAIGHMLTTMVLADASYFEDAETPLIGIVSGPAAVSQGFEYLCIATGTDLQQADTLVDYLVGERGCKKISLVNVNTEGGMSAATEIESYLQSKYNLTLATHDQLAMDNTDFTAQVLNIKDAGSDCVIYWGLDQAGGQIFYTQLGQMYTSDIVFAGGTNLAQAQMLDTWNETDIQGVVFPVGYIPTEDENVVRFQNYFTEADPQKQPAADVPARVYDAVWHIATALNDMGVMDVNGDDFNKTLNNALRNAKFTGVQGEFDFSAFDNGVGLGQMNIGMWGEAYSQSKVYPAN